jgi:hypothetical protein
MFIDIMSDSKKIQDRLIAQAEEEVTEFQLNFGNPSEIPAEKIREDAQTMPIPQIDEHGDHELENLPDELSQEEIDECYQYEEYKTCKKSSRKVKSFFSAPEMFCQAYAAGAGSPLESFYREIIGDVFKFCKALGVKPHWQQKQLLKEYQDGKSNIACRSGQGPGKTFISTVIWLHWLLANPYGLLVVTAPTMRQCKEVWLSAARQIIADADPRIKIAYEFTGTGIKMFGNKASDWGCYLATANKPENFQGIHREKLGIHCEEASGLDKPIIETIQGTLSNAEGTYLWLQIGNPNTRDSPFYDCFYAPGTIWTCLHWNGEETPETPFFSQRRNKEVAEEHGRDSDVYRVRVLGEFPSLDPSAMISLEELRECCKPATLMKAAQINSYNAGKGKLRRQIGIDLARMGGDENVIAPWNGNILKTMECYSRTDPNDAVDRAVFLQAEYEWSNSETLYIVDTSGMGEGVVGRLGQEKRMGRRVHEFYSQNTASDSSKYANKITEAWHLFCKAVRKGEIYMKYDKKTFDQLSSRKYRIDKHGRILLESKDDYKKRQKGGDVGELGKSPDRADAVIMGWYTEAEDSVRVIGFGT